MSFPYFGFQPSPPNPINSQNPLKVKVSQYPFKQNKNILKSKIRLPLYTYFYNISFKVLRPTFASIYNLYTLFTLSKCQ